jgi:hypothetical protein
MAKEHPILFSTDMVKAILEGRKTQTRRVIKPQPVLMDKHYFKDFRKDAGGRVCPYGQVGDRLWVRETWLPFEAQGPNAFLYKADIALINLHYLKWQPSIFMPRKASRITLEITNTRVERLHDITGADLLKEGIAHGMGGFKAYEELWNNINGKKYPWESNPWVWVIEFRRVANG